MLDRRRTARSGRIGVGVIAGSLVVYLLLGHTGLLPVAAGGYENWELRITDCEGTQKGHLRVEVARTFEQKYVGLSRTESLGPDEGMVFLFEEEGSKRIEMRNMNFDLDVLFVGADRRINGIGNGDAPDSPLEYYLLYDSVAGEGKFVIEVSGGWSAEHDVSAGDCVKGLPPANGS